MTYGVPVECLHFHSTEVLKHGKSAVGKQRYRCQNSECPYRTFVLDQTYPGRTRQVRQQIVEMTLNGSGVRDIARVLHVNPTMPCIPFVQTVQAGCGIECLNRRYR